jgi:diaminohydroxyphosphoribosylaminopyrimidine deaminase/5-amino-6-(5-phosphoribosylamino)uracil reductase
VFDSRLRLPPTSRLVRTARRAPVWVLTLSNDRRRRARLERLGAQVVVVRGRRRGRVPPSAALRELSARGIGSVMVEGGSELLGSFLSARLFDRIVLFRAPVMLGGRGSRAAFGGPDPLRLADAVRLRAEPPLPGAEVWSRER